MFEALKEKLAVSDEEIITVIALEREAEIKRQAAKAKRKAMAEIFKTKDDNYLGVTVKKRDGAKKSFFVQQ